jgi:hypothetical protein
MHIGTSSSQPETEEHLLSIYLVFVPSSLLAFLLNMFLLRPLYHRDRRMLSISLTPMPSFFFLFISTVYSFSLAPSLCFLNPITSVLLTYMDTSSLHCSWLLLGFMTFHSIDVIVSLLYHHYVWTTYRPSKSINLYHATFFAYTGTLLPYMQTFFLHCLLLYSVIHLFVNHSGPYC